MDITKASSFWLAIVLMAPEMSIAQMPKTSNEMVAVVAAGVCEGTSGLERLKCSEDALKSAEARMRTAYESMMEPLPKRGDGDEPDRRLLAESQRAWTKFRDLYCAFIGRTKGQLQEQKVIEKLRCQIQLTGDRTRWLNGEW